MRLGDLAASFDLDGARQVALGDRGRDLGDGAHLRREVGGQRVDVPRQILPRAGGARNVGLPAELAFDADFPRDGRHLIGEGGRAFRSCC